MSIEEITDWMAYERSTTPEFKKRQVEKERIAKDKDQESNLIKNLFQSLSDNENG